MAGLLEGVGAGQFAVYVDPAILIVLSVCMAPFPAAMIARAGREILQIAPPDLDARRQYCARRGGAARLCRPPILRYKGWSRPVH